MSQTVICSQCSRPLPPDAPDALCPYCLLAEAEEPTTVATSPGFRPPSVEELQKRFPFDQLEIVALIGSGGMGAVYRARQPRLMREVALKILPPEIAATPGFDDRFAREARVLAQLDHVNVVDVHDYGAAGPYSYLVLEYVDGVNLRELIRGEEMATSDAMEIIPQLCDALQYAHDRGIVHRDIKPENILIDSRGRVKITDFGLAKLARSDEVDHRLTGTHQVMGTPSYMAPEQIEKPREVDHRADIYALGVVFYELLTGELPLGRFLPPSEKGKSSRRLDKIVMKTLEKQPERRYEHASDVKSDVEKVSAEKPFHSAAAEFVAESAGQAGASVAAFSRMPLARTIGLVLTILAAYLTVVFSPIFPLLLLVTIVLCFVVETLMPVSNVPVSNVPAWLAVIAGPPLFVARGLRHGRAAISSKLTGSQFMKRELPHLAGRESIGLVLAVVFFLAAIGFLFAIPVENDFTPAMFMMLIASYLAARYQLSDRPRSELSATERWLLYPPIMVVAVLIMVPFLLLPGVATAGLLIADTEAVRRTLGLRGPSSPISAMTWSVMVALTAQFLWLALITLLARWTRRPLRWLAHPLLERWTGRWTVLWFLAFLAMGTVTGTLAWIIAV